MRNNPAFKRLQTAAETGGWDNAALDAKTDTELEAALWPPGKPKPVQCDTRTSSARECLRGVLREKEHEQKRADFEASLQVPKDFTIVSVEYNPDTGQYHAAFSKKPAISDMR